MKKLAILIVLLISPLVITAQNTFDSFENEDDVTSVIVTKNMFKLLSSKWISMFKDQLIIKNPL